MKDEICHDLNKKEFTKKPSFSPQVYIMKIDDENHTPNHKREQTVIQTEFKAGKEYDSRSSRYSPNQPKGETSFTLL